MDYILSIKTQTNYFKMITVNIVDYLKKQQQTDKVGYDNNIKALCEFIEPMIERNKMAPVIDSIVAIKDEYIGCLNGIATKFKSMKKTSSKKIMSNIAAAMTNDIANIASIKTWSGANSNCGYHDYGMNIVYNDGKERNIVFSHCPSDSCYSNFEINDETFDTSYGMFGCLKKIQKSIEETDVTETEFDDCRFVSAIKHRLSDVDEIADFTLNHVYISYLDKVNE